MRVKTLRDHIAEETENFALELYNPQVEWAWEWHTPYRPCPSRWYEGFDRLPKTRTINANIIDPGGTSYENQKYGAGYTGTVWGE